HIGYRSCIQSVTRLARHRARTLRSTNWAVDPVAGRAPPRSEIPPAGGKLLGVAGFRGHRPTRGTLRVLLAGSTRSTQPGHSLRCGRRRLRTVEYGYFSPAARANHQSHGESLAPSCLVFSADMYTPPKYGENLRVRQRDGPVMNGAW